MTKMEKIETIADLLQQKYGHVAAVASYLKGMASTYIDETNIDFHVEQLTKDLQKECGL